jgi:hypothetical protein
MNIKSVYTAKELGSTNYCKVKQPLWFRVNYFLFFLFFSGKLDWKNSWFNKRKEGYKTVYSGILFDKTMNHSFAKITNTTNYNTECKHIGDLYLNLSLETAKDLSVFCGKKFTTKDSCALITAPTKYDFLKYFYPKTFTVKYEGAVLYVNVLNQLVKKENL